MKQKIFILSIVVQFISLCAFSQNSALKTEEMFDKYGKREGSVLLQLSSDVLSQGSNITFYKSLILDENTQNRQDILNALKSDTQGKITISEVKKDGLIESASYYIGRNKTSNSEFILYKNKGKKITLVYLKGNFPSGHLEVELKKLKDLFIYVNNKRIKL
ncbi:hypothetical protein [Prevotella sp. 10(H)]|uniref:hypothetical protein n=1 Tax=Prevotella sp. 10(H) TaxID=1158294 RepID=UPI0004A72C44|nr:hypothetical protein [Prevotella sp. 10(H)]